MTGTSTGPDRADAALVDGLVQSSFAVAALLSQIAARYDLSLTQLRVIAILRDRTPAMAELADHLGLERSSVSGLIDRAAGRGLVRREPSSQDARSTLVGLTPAGQRLADELTAEFGALLRPLTGRLRPAEQRRLAVLLGRLLG